MCLTLCDPVDCSQAPGKNTRVGCFCKNTGVGPFCRGPSQPRDRTWVFLHCRQILYQLSHHGSSITREKKSDKSLERRILQNSWPAVPPRCQGHQNEGKSEEPSQPRRGRSKETRRIHNVIYVMGCLGGVLEGHQGKPEEIGIGSEVGLIGMLLSWLWQTSTRSYALCPPDSALVFLQSHRHMAPKGTLPTLAVLCSEPSGDACLTKV